MLNNSVKFTGFDISVIFPNDKDLQNIDPDLDTIGVCTDSRIIEKGNIFVAIKGENFDGHDKVAESFEKGAAAALVSREWYDKNHHNFKSNSFIIADDTISAMGKLAKYHRMRFDDIQILTVAGSNGKTSTKEMIAKVLSQKYNILCTHGNFNNQIGVPLMLFQLDDSYQVAVLEIGTNMPGEILTLTNMIKPTHGLVTNIGKEHLEQLIDIDGVELEETSMFADLRTEGHCFINFDDERLKRYGHVLEKITTYGTDKNAMVTADIEIDGQMHPQIKINWTEEEREINVKLKTFGIFSAKNAIAAATVGFFFNLSDDEIKKGLESFESLRSEIGYGRMNFETHQNINFINDTYNSNPSSAESALSILKSSEAKGRRIAILGDMLELGESTHQEHIELINKALDSADEIFLFGGNLDQACKNHSDKSNLHCFTNKDALIERLEKSLKEGDLVLVKGSRGMRMEDVIIHYSK